MTGKKILIVISAVLLALCFIIAACKIGHSDKEAKIGVLLAFTGDLADLGNDIKNGAYLAKKHIDAAGGVMGKELKLVQRDTQTDPKAGVDAAKKLITIDKVVAITGALSSGVTIPVSAEASKARVIQISPSSTSPEISKLNDDDFLFRTCPSDSLQGVVLADIAFKEYQYKAVSIIYVNNDYGQGLADSFQSSFEKRGGKVLASIPYEKGQADYSSEVAKATTDLAEKTDAVGIFGYPENGEKIIRNIIELQALKNIFYADGMQAPELFESIDSSELEGTWGTAGGSVETESLSLFMAEYEKEFGKKPPKPYITNIYDAVAILALAMTKAGTTTDTVKIRDAIRDVANPPGEKVYVGQFKKAYKLIKEGKDIDYLGAAGENDFDKNGDVSTPFVLWEVKDNTVKELKTVQAPTE